MELPVRVNRDFASRYPRASASATECSMNLVRTGDLVFGRVAAALQRLEISPAGGLALGIVKDAGQPCPPKYISERLIVSRATVTGVLDTLAKRGLIRREPHPTDRRMVMVHLTKEGSRMADRVRAIVHEAEAEWMSPLNERDRSQLIDLLGKVQRHLS